MTNGRKNGVGVTEIGGSNIITLNVPRSIVRSLKEIFNSIVNRDFAEDDQRAVKWRMCGLMVKVGLSPSRFLLVDASTRS